jgi:hypothetical protein
MSDSDSDNKSDISLDDIIEFDLDEFNMASKYDMHNYDIRYSGSPNDDVDTFISSFKNYAKLRDFIEEKSVLALQTKIYGHARIYLDSIAIGEKNTIDKIEQLFKDNFEGSSWKWNIESKLLSRKQLPAESHDDYACDIIKWCKQLKKSDSEQLSVFVRGLLPSVRAFVFAKEPKTFKEALDAARLGISVQQTAKESSPSMNTESPQVSVNSIHSTLDTLTGIVSNIATRMEKLEHNKHVSFSSPVKEHSSSSANEHNFSQTGTHPSQVPRRKLVCDRCGRVGHGWRKCYAKYDINRIPLN